MQSIAAVDAVIARSLGARSASSTAAAAFSWRRPRAGSTALLRFDHESAPASRISESVFQERSVLLLPSTVFDFGDRHLRLGLGRAGFVTALAELAAFLGGRPSRGDGDRRRRTLSTHHADSAPSQDHIDEW